MLLPIQHPKPFTTHFELTVKQQISLLFIFITSLSSENICSLQQDPRPTQCFRDDKHYQTHPRHNSILCFSLLHLFFIFLLQFKHGIYCNIFCKLKASIGFNIVHNYILVTTAEWTNNLAVAWMRSGLTALRSGLSLGYNVELYMRTPHIYTHFLQSLQFPHIKGVFPPLFLRNTLDTP